MGKIFPHSYSFFMWLFSFWFSIFPVYLYFSTSETSDICSAVLSLENIDEEDSTPNVEKKEKVERSPLLIKHMVMGYLFLTRVPNLFFELQTSDIKPLILRC
jgi:hypothetical protein